MFSLISSKQGGNAQKAQRSLRIQLSHAQALVLVFIACIASMVYFTPAKKDTNLQIESFLNPSVASQTQWATKGQEYSNWIIDHVGPAGGFLFGALQSALDASLEVLSSSGQSHADMVWLQKFWLGLHFGFLQLAFVIVAWWKVWIVLALVSFLWGIFNLQVYSGLDLLGQLGNGRPFFSGIRIDPKKFSNNGAPALQVTGMACPGTVGIGIAKESHLAKMLEKFSALNTVNYFLLSVVLKHQNWPAFLNTADSANLIDKELQTIGLLQSVEKSLEVVFALRSQYGAMRNAISSAVEDPKLLRGNLTFNQYSELLRYSIDRALTAAQKEDLGSMPAPMVATAILALKAGHVLAMSRVGDSWSWTSNFLNLSARAVLHSAPQLSEEYDFETRTDIRRALVYSKRNGILSPQGFAVDTSNRSMALRQIVEILMASPYELASVADEVELFGIISEAQRAFGNVLGDAALGGGGEYLESGLGFNKVFFLNFKEVERLLRSSIERPQLERLKKLHAVVSKRQHIRQMSTDQSFESSKSQERLPLPIVDQGDLSVLHKLSPAAVADWSAYRLILSAGGWLARRVGDYNLPDSHLCALVYRPFNTAPNSSQNGGSVAMVALRASRLNDRFGTGWASQLVPLREVALATSSADFSKKLSSGARLSLVDSAKESLEDVQNI